MPSSRRVAIIAWTAAGVILLLILLATRARAGGGGTPSRTRLDCIASFESEHRAGGSPYVWQRHRDSGYFGKGWETPGGGRYQFTQGTWNGAVTRAGFPKYAGHRPSSAPSEIQDAAAVRLHEERGLQPWTNGQQRCGRF